jgi:Protein of unknown function (DUF3134)
MYNPSLREEPIEQTAAVIPTKHESSILDWLEATGRLLARDDQQLEAGYLEDEGEDLEGLMSGDDGDFTIDDDDDDEPIELD